MEFRKVESAFFVRLEKGEEIVETLTSFVQKQNIAAGSVSGIGATDSVTLKYYNRELKKYVSNGFDGEYEILALGGNISLMDGKPWPHLHVVISGPDYRCIGGHLESATVGVTCEIVIHTAETQIERVMDEEIGVKLWQLS